MNIIDNLIMKLWKKELDDIHICLEESDKCTDDIWNRDDVSLDDIFRLSKKFCKLQKRIARKMKIVHLCSDLVGDVEDEKNKEIFH